MSLRAFGDLPVGILGVAGILGPGGELDWAMLLTLVLSVLILVLIGLSRVLYRRRQAEGNALWLHLLALGLLPVALVGVGNVAVMEYAKDVHFCGSCHAVMKPYVDDLHKVRGQSLAALHFQHRAAPGTECYACHADYGLYGTVQAKRAGLRHLYRYLSGSYRLPLRMHTEFSNGLCLKCHDGAKRFMDQEIHLDDGKVSADLRTGQTECVQCHRPAHDLPRPRRAAAGGPA